MQISRRDLARWGGATAWAGALGQALLPQEGHAASAAVDPLALVNPELRPMAERLRAMSAAAPPLTNDSLASMRSRGLPSAPLLADVAVEERRIPGPKGAPEVLVHVINAAAGTSRPAIVDLHGGGMVAGSAKAGIAGLQARAKALNCVAVSVEYRLAPEARWSDSVEDNYAALHWLHAHSEELGVDRARIALCGGSAGGGHAVLLAIAARDRGELPLCFQMLMSPMLDDRTGSSHQPPAHLGAFSWSREQNRFGWRSFLGVEPGQPTVPRAAVPARVENLSGLPPTFISVGSLDLFVGEDVAFAQRLIDAGVPTELHVAPGAFHGSELIVPNAAISRQQQSIADSALRRALGVAAA